MSKEAMRQESERLVREAMMRNVTITEGKTRLDLKCSKCGAPKRLPFPLRIGSNVSPAIRGINRPSTTLAVESILERD